MSPIAWITKPLNALLVTGAVFIAALVTSSVITPPEPPTPTVNVVPTVAETLRYLTIHVDTDGQIHVNGIPDTTPPLVAEHLIAIATTAATARLGKIQRTRSTLTRDDRRLLTKVARAAVRQTA